MVWVGTLVGRRGRSVSCDVVVVLLLLGPSPCTALVSMLVARDGPRTGLDWIGLID